MFTARSSANSSRDRIRRLGWRAVTATASHSVISVPYERGGNPYLPPGGGKFAESPDIESDPWGWLTTFEPEEPSEPTSLTKR